MYKYINITFVIVDLRNKKCDHPYATSSVVKDIRIAIFPTEMSLKIRVNGYYFNDLTQHYY